MQRSVEWGVLTYTMHPYVIGRGYRMLALEQLLDNLESAGAVFMTLEEAVAEARARMF
jgi:peptidoglycan/xylan/chitin deacetylase (PgdA/CDA1 family)